MVGSSHESLHYARPPQTGWATVAGFGRTQPLGPALEFAPPLVITKEELDRALGVLDEVLTEPHVRAR
ncbi:MAG: hypothetical protein ACYC33_07625, partial [Thermoleophilia bacterium]